MIHYHGLPITPDADCATIMLNRHAMISFAYPDQLSLASEVCSSFILDCGAFTEWKRGSKVDLKAYLDWAAAWSTHPGFEWCIIPDSIQGTEDENDALLTGWPLRKSISVPVWHLHESVARLARLGALWPRVALGSSGEYSTPGSPLWWSRIGEAMDAICDGSGRPRCKLHGLRMLDARILRHLPLASADSTNVARNIGIDAKWAKGYSPPTKAARGVILAQRIESQQSAERWTGLNQSDLFQMEHTA